MKVRVGVRARVGSGGEGRGPQPARTGRLQHLAVDAVREQAEQPPLPRHAGQQLGPRHRLLRVPLLDAAPAAAARTVTAPHRHRPRHRPVPALTRRPATGPAAPRTGSAASRTPPWPRRRPGPTRSDPGRPLRHRQRRPRRRGAGDGSAGTGRACAADVAGMRRDARGSARRRAHGGHTRTHARGAHAQGARGAPGQGSGAARAWRGHARPGASPPRAADSPSAARRPPVALSSLATMMPWFNPRQPEPRSWSSSSPPSLRRVGKKGGKREKNPRGLRQFNTTITEKENNNKKDTTHSHHTCPWAAPFYAPSMPSVVQNIPRAVPLFCLYSLVSLHGKLREPLKSINISEQLNQYVLLTSLSGQLLERKLSLSCLGRIQAGAGPAACESGR